MFYDILKSRPADCSVHSKSFPPFQQQFSNAAHLFVGSFLTKKTQPFLQFANVGPEVPGPISPTYGDHAGNEWDASWAKKCSNWLMDDFDVLVAELANIPEILPGSSTIVKLFLF